MELKKVDDKNIWKVIKLSVKEDQKDFVATNTESILEAYTTITSGRVALPFGIYDDDETLVGFVMFGYDSSDEDDPAVAKGNYCIWRFMIDKSYQGKGLGRKALKTAIEYIQTNPCGQAEYCWLSYEPENVAAKSLYNSMGFIENGQMCDDEIVAVLKLEEYFMKEENPVELFDMKVAHVGINADDDKEALQLAKKFLSLMDLQINETPVSYFNDSLIEIMKMNGRGTNGHIGFAVNDCEKAMKYFEDRGMKIVEETKKFNKDGKCTFVYFDEEIGGFAVHLIQK